MVIIDEKQYKKAFKEVLVILNVIPNEYYDKIPKEIILTLEQFQDEYYEYELEFNKEFKEQNISEVSKAILANFYRDYWASDSEKTEIMEKEKIQRIKLEDEKRKKYNPEDIFKVFNKKENQIENKNDDNSLILKKNISFLQKLIIKIKEILKIN